MNGCDIVPFLLTIAKISDLLLLWGAFCQYHKSRLGTVIVHASVSEAQRRAEAVICAGNNGGRPAYLVWTDLSDGNNTNTKDNVKPFQAKGFIFLTICSLAFAALNYYNKNTFSHERVFFMKSIPEGLHGLQIKKAPLEEGILYRYLPPYLIVPLNCSQEHLELALTTFIQNSKRGDFHAYE